MNPCSSRRLLLSLGCFLTFVICAQCEKWGGDAGCVTSCENMPDGNYPSCMGCGLYCSCRQGSFLDSIPCPPGYYWNKAIGRCHFGPCRFKREVDLFCTETVTTSISQEECETTSTDTITKTDTTIIPKQAALVCTTYSKQEITEGTRITNTQVEEDVKNTYIISTSTDIRFGMETTKVDGRVTTEYTTSTIVDVDANTVPYDDIETFTTTVTTTDCTATSTTYPKSKVTQYSTSTPVRFRKKDATTTSTLTVTSTSTKIKTEFETETTGKTTDYTSTTTICNPTTRDSIDDQVFVYTYNFVPISVSTRIVSPTTTITRSTTKTPIASTTTVVEEEEPTLWLTTTNPIEEIEEIELVTTDYTQLPDSSKTITSTVVDWKTDYTTVSMLDCSDTTKSLVITETVVEKEDLDLLTVTCTGKLLVFIDGVLQVAPPSELNNMYQVSTFELPRDASLVALECCRDEDIEGPPGIIASDDVTNLVTDRSWYCSPIHRTGWSLPNYEMDESYFKAVVIGDNGDPPGSIPEIHASAKWIWAKNDFQQGDHLNNAFCRKLLRK